MADNLRDDARDTTGAVERQEARGQQKFVDNETLPAELGRVSPEGAKTKAALEKAGVVFHGPVPGDELFQNVTLPPGWKKVGSDHPLWSKLLNENGDTVATIFYKAAFHDRRAFLGLDQKWLAAQATVGTK